MECGEIDFAHILAKHQGVPLGLNFIRVYWEQMLRAVQVIHDEKIVHSDLKPANFLLVQGQLKLIDFGIAKRMGDDTTNIHRDQQVRIPQTPASQQNMSLPDFHPFPKFLRIYTADV